jgi:nitrate reductase delta subunit
METQAIYDRLAALLTYPDADYDERIGECASAAGIPAADALGAFTRRTAGFTTTDFQELFTTTFDLNPLCSLEIGWHLFGENYDRGSLLVRLRCEMKDHCVVENVELPDHLSNVLPLIARMPHERAGDFIAACVQPAICRMLDAFADKNNPYKYVLEALNASLHADFPELPLTVAAQPELRVFSPGAAL